LLVALDVAPLFCALYGIGKVSILKLENAVQGTAMPVGAKNLLFGVFDEQAASVLTVLLHKEAGFTELTKETRLSKASLYRVLSRLEQADAIERTERGYLETRRGRRIMRLFRELGEEDTEKAMAYVGRRLVELQREYRATRRVFHKETDWERTAEKPLIEVLATLKMSPVETLLFHQRFQEEVAREEKKLKSSPPER